MQKRSSVFRNVQGLTLAAMMAAMSVMIGIFCKNFLNFGNGLFRITFENIPIIFSGIVFGPIVGGMVGVGSDLISYLLSNQIYPPNLIVTLGACSIGVVSGLVSRFAVRKRGTLQIVFSAGLAHVIGSMTIKTFGLYQFYGIAVLLRIPLYLAISTLEICILCWLFRRKSIQRMIESR
ncbi:MAG: folate family ECF transporter S component [Ruminococcaceae bacterium]|nr:folate family ECF transporter S component [Oscillospiraceae bacterium]